MSEPAQVKHCRDCGVVLITGENWTQNNCKQRDYLCKACRAVRSKAVKERNMANGMCQNHPLIPLDPQSRNFCPKCFNKSNQRAEERRKKVVLGGCEKSGCYKPHVKNSIHCLKHRNIQRRQVGEANAKRKGIRWLKKAPPEEFKKWLGNGCCFPEYGKQCGQKKNGNALHRDHHHGVNNVGWLRGILCSPHNTMLKSTLTDQSPEAAREHFLAIGKNPRTVEDIYNYLNDPPYFRFLDYKGIERPRPGETPAEYYKRHPEQALSSKANRKRKYDW